MTTKKRAQGRAQGKTREQLKAQAAEIVAAGNLKYAETDADLDAGSYERALRDVVGRAEKGSLRSTPTATSPRLSPPRASSMTCSKLPRAA